MDMKECIDEENTMLNYTRYKQFIYSEISEITIPGFLPWHISGLVHLYWDTYWAAMVYWECLKAFEPPGPTKVLGFMDPNMGRINNHAAIK